jgi:elongation factor P
MRAERRGTAHRACCRKAPAGKTPDQNSGDFMLKATQLRPGMIIKHEGDLHAIYSVDHRTPGNKRGSMQTKMRNLRNGSMIDYRFRAEEFVEKVVVDEIAFEYLYSDGDGHHFMNTENYEQLQLQDDVVGDTKEYLIPNLPVKIEYYDEKPIGVLLPDTVDLTVVETEQTIQKATASAVMKPAKLETGLIINVPPFVGEGDKVKVDTSEGRYIQRIQ